MKLYKLVLIVLVLVGGAYFIGGKINKENNKIKEVKHYDMLVCTEYAIYDNVVGDCIKFINKRFYK